MLIWCWRWFIVELLQFGDKLKQKRKIKCPSNLTTKYVFCQRLAHAHRQISAKLFGDVRVGVSFIPVQIVSLMISCFFFPASNPPPKELWARTYDLAWPSGPYNVLLRFKRRARWVVCDLWFPITVLLCIHPQRHLLVSSENKESKDKSQKIMMFIFFLSFLKFLLFFWWNTGFVFFTSGL